MCGIVCIISNSHLDLNGLNKLRDYLSHRGPDGQGLTVEIDQNYQVALGHRRLAVLDLSSDALQPMKHSEVNVEIVFNGELYNYRELRKTLMELGYCFKTQSDTEVLLTSYLAWGNDCLEKLNGMFAFAIWDKRQKKILIARDRFGEKPLYWAKLPNNSGLIFASEMKAILQYPAFDKSLNYSTLEKYVNEAQSVTNHYKTPFLNIEQVPSGAATLVNHRAEIERNWFYWNPDFTQEHGNYNPKTAQETFHHLLEKSVLDRAHCDVQFSACLSGGLDSTSIVGILNQHQPKNFASTLSIRFDEDPTISDGSYIDKATKQFNLNHIMVQPKIEDLIKDSAKIHWHHEIPLASTSMFLEWSLMKKARELGNVVMLDGQGSDELLGGYPYYFKLYQEESLNRKNYRDLLINTFNFKNYLKEESRKYKDSHRRIPMETFYDLQTLFLLKFKQSIKNILLGNRNQKQALENNNDIISKSTYTQHIKYPDQKYKFKHKIATGLTSTVLQEQLHSADRNGMAFGIETRFPFLDYELVDWAIGLPLHSLINQGFQKHILRKATEGLIPSEITYRKDKLGYLAPEDAWIKGPLQTYIKERIFTGPVLSLDFYKESNLNLAWKSFMQDKDTMYNAQFFWRFASLNEWMQVFELTV